MLRPVEGQQSLLVSENVPLLPATIPGDDYLEKVQFRFGLSRDFAKVVDAGIR